MGRAEPLPRADFVTLPAWAPAATIAVTHGETLDAHAGALLRMVGHIPSLQPARAAISAGDQQLRALIRVVAHRLARDNRLASLAAQPFEGAHLVVLARVDLADGDAHTAGSLAFGRPPRAHERMLLVLLSICARDPVARAAQGVARERSLAGPWEEGPLRISKERAGGVETDEAHVGHVEQNHARTASRAKVTPDALVVGTERWETIRTRHESSSRGDLHLIRPKWDKQHAKLRPRRAERFEQLQQRHNIAVFRSDKDERQIALVGAAQRDSPSISAARAAEMEPFLSASDNERPSLSGGITCGDVAFNSSCFDSAGSKIGSGLMTNEALAAGVFPRPSRLASSGSHGSHTIGETAPLGPEPSNPHRSLIEVGAPTSAPPAVAKAHASSLANTPWSAAVPLAPRLLAGGCGALPPAAAAVDRNCKSRNRTFLPHPYGQEYDMFGQIRSCSASPRRDT
eukprot:scaffold185184_cov29-Tisochrysis_lutea.AAC.6